MQCNQSSGERFPGNWEGLSKPEFPLPVLPLVLKSDESGEKCSSDSPGIKVQHDIRKPLDNVSELEFLPE